MLESSHLRGGKHRADLWEIEILSFLVAGERWLCFCQVLPSTYLEEVLVLNLSTSLFPLKHSRFGR